MNMMQPSNAIMQWATTAGLTYPGKGGKRKMNSKTKKGGKRKTYRHKSHKLRKTHHKKRN
jgi:hypothetical protein